MNGEEDSLYGPTTDENSVQDRRSADRSSSPSPVSRMVWYRRLAYGVGHVQNDLCASMWFTYLIVFLTKVLGFDPGRAGTVILIGQLTDAIATPLVGIESDRVDLWPFCIRIGRRRLWHVFGTICVTLSFPFLFKRCFACTDETSDLVQLIYYTPFVMIFQIGWASVQIAHLALIPELSSCQHERITLNGIRYAFTVIANIAVFVAMWISMGYDPHHRDVTPHDELAFLYIAVGVVVLGFIFSLGFQLLTKEPIPLKLLNRRRYAAADEDGRAIKGLDDQSFSAMTWRDWLKNLQFYQVALMYMCSRLFTNITQTYLPLYILETQHFDKKFIAIIPLVVYVSGFATSFLLSFKFISRLLGRRLGSLIGITIGAGACVWLWFHNLHDQIFGVSILLGMSSTILMVTSLAMTTDLINCSTESGAFVFGVMSFFDKVSTGVAIQLVQFYQPSECLIDAGCPARDLYFRYIMVFVSGGALIFAAIALVMLWRQSIGERRRPPVTIRVTPPDEPPVNGNSA